MDLFVAFVLGAAAWWAINVLARSMAFGSRKIGSEIRQKWLAKLDYDSLLRMKKQLEDEISRRQP